MNQLEQNIVESFRLAKNDIMELQTSLTALSQNQERIMEWVNDTRDKENQLYQRVKGLKTKATKTKKPVAAVRTSAKKKFVASKNGKTVHEINCPFAKNIKPKSKIVFNSKTKALNAGYKACNCMKKV